MCWVLRLESDQAGRRGRGGRLVDALAFDPMNRGELAHGED